MIFDSAKKGFKAYFSNIAILLIMSAIYIVLTKLVLTLGQFFFYYCFSENGIFDTNAKSADPLGFLYAALTGTNTYSAIETIGINLIFAVFAAPINTGFIKSTMSIAGGGGAKISDCFYFYRSPKLWAKASLLVFLFTTLIGIFQSFFQLYTLKIDWSFLLLIMSSLAILFVGIMFFPIIYLFGEHPEMKLSELFYASRETAKGYRMKYIGLSVFTTFLVLIIGNVFTPITFLPFDKDFLFSVSGQIKNLFINPLVKCITAFFIYSVIHMKINADNATFTVESTDVAGEEIL